MDTTLVIIQYEWSYDHPFLVDNTQMILEYLENDGNADAVMLANITDNQKAEILKKGMKVEELERNPDLTNYILLYHPLPNQGSKLSELGRIYLLSDNHTLIRIKDGTAFSHTGVASQFMMVPLQEIHPVTSLSLTTTQTQLKNSSQIEKSKFSRTTVVIIVIVIILVILAVFYIYKTWKTSSEE